MQVLLYMSIYKTGLDHFSGIFLFAFFFVDLAARERDHIKTLTGTSGLNVRCDVLLEMCLHRSDQRRFVVDLYCTFLLSVYSVICKGRQALPFPQSTDR